METPTTPTGAARLIAILIKVSLLLVFCDRFVTGSFYENRIKPRYVKPSEVLRDRTASQNLRIFFDSVGRIPASETVVAFVGDSTMNDAEEVGRNYVPNLIRSGLQQRIGNAALTTIDASVLGMFARDAALFIAKLFDNGADIVVYGVTLRAFPRQTYDEWASHVNGELGFADLHTLNAAGATAWLLRQIPAEQLAAGIVWSNWALYAYRSELRRYAWDVGLAPLLGEESWLAPWLKPAPPRVRVPVSRAVEHPTWARESYGPPNANWEALEVIGRLCRRQGIGRCVFYAGPVNPAARNAVAKEEFYRDYLIRLREVVKRHQQTFLDFTEHLNEDEFHPPRFLGPDPIHPNLSGRIKLTALLTDPVSDAVLGFLDEDSTMYR